MPGETVVREVPRCPFTSCEFGRNPNTESRVNPLTTEGAHATGIEANQPLFRCGYCQNVWREPIPNMIQPIGLLSFEGELLPFKRPATIALARGQYLGS